jgi:hypothetical protein
VSANSAPAIPYFTLDLIRAVARRKRGVSQRLMAPRGLVKATAFWSVCILAACLHQARLIPQVERSSRKPAPQGPLARRCVEQRRAQQREQIVREQTFGLMLNCPLERGSPLLAGDGRRGENCLRRRGFHSADHIVFFWRSCPWSKASKALRALRCVSIRSKMDCPSRETSLSILPNTGEGRLYPHRHDPWRRAR